MAATAVFECQIAAESSTTVVTGNAALAARSWEVFGRGGRTHLPRLCGAGGQCVAIGATEALRTGMLRVTKRIAKRSRIRRRARVRPLVVANATRRHLSTRIRLAARRMAGVTLVMRRKTNGDVERSRAISDPAMAGRTSACRPRRSGHVLRMVKLYVEAFIETERETFQRRI